MYKLNFKCSPTHEIKMKTIVPLASGFEEIEAVTIIDTLRRADIEVITASLTDLEVKGAHEIILHADTRLEQVKMDTFDAIILPGGMPGTKHLLESKHIQTLITEFHNQGKIVAAICAAPWVLSQANLLKGKKATCYPGVEKNFDGVDISHENVVIADHIITSRGPATALEFSLTLVRVLKGDSTADDLAQKMLFNS